MDKKLLLLNLKCFVLNGLMWLGTVLVYKAFTGMVLVYSFGGEEAENSQEVDSTGTDILSLVWQAIVTIVIMSMDLLHNSWLMFIYIATLVLTTLWVQEIFDHIMDAKLKKIKERGEEDKRIKFQPLTTKDVLSDLVSRTVIITIYLLLCRFLCKVTVPWLSTVIELVTTSLVHAFYCFEYKTGAAGIDTTNGLALFEKQWIY